MKKIIIFFILTAPFISAFNPAPDLPPKDCLWFLPTMTIEQAKGLLKYNQITVDPECAINSRSSLDYLRDNHPGIKILCYINVPEWFDPMFSDKPWSLDMVARLKKYPEWWLRGTDGQRISFWSGMYTMNCCWDCPKYLINGQKMNYVQFITNRFIADILKKYKFDGILSDNSWDEPYWLGHYGQNHAGIDRNHDKKEDSPLQFNQSWQAGLNYFFRKIREFGGQNFIIMANPGNNCYAKYCNGKEYENFPEIYLNEQDRQYEAWYENLNYAASWKGPCIFVARENNYFFTLCSAVLLDNVHFADGQNKPYNQKYELYLGQPNGQAEIFDSGYKREFQNGTVYVSPPDKAWIIYRDGHKRSE